MKILIAYAGKSGTCRRAAKDLAAALPAFSVCVADLNEETPDPAEFDYVILGGAVRYRKLPRALRRYCKAGGERLAQMPHALFVCCGLAEFFESYAEWGFGKKLCESAERVLYFGGELNVAENHGFDRLIVRAMRRSILEDEEGERTLPGYLPEHVRLFAEYLREKNS